MKYPIASIEFALALHAFFAVNKLKQVVDAQKLYNDVERKIRRT